MAKSACSEFDTLSIKNSKIAVYVGCLFMVDHRHLCTGGLMQKWHNFTANALEVHFFWIQISIHNHLWYYETVPVPGQLSQVVSMDFGYQQYHVVS